MWLEFGVIVVLFVIIMLVGSKNYLPFHTTPANLQVLEDPNIIKSFKNDILLIADDDWIIEKNIINHGSDNKWIAFPICINGDWQDRNARKCVNISDKLRSINNATKDIVSISICKMNQLVSLEKNNGFESDNTVLRSMLLLTETKCGVNVMGNDKSLEYGKWTTIDASLQHAFFNADKKDSVFLTVTTLRDPKLANGKATSVLPPELLPVALAI